MQYSNALFREEAINGQHKDKLGNGSLLRLPRPQHLIIVCVLLLVVGSFIYLLITHTYTSKVSVVGWLVTEKANIDIYPLEQSSLLSELAVKPNQTVSKGELLAHFIRPDAQLRGEVFIHKQRTSTQTQLDLLTEQKALNTRQYQQNLLQNKKLLINLDAQLVTARHRLSHIENLLSLHKTEEQEIHKLYQLGSISKAKFRLTQEKGLQLEIQRSDAALSLQNLAQSQDSAQHRQQTLAIQHSEKQSKLINQIEQLKQSLVSSQEAYSYSIFSPIDGIISNIQVEEGERLHPNTFMMQINPLDHELKVRMYIPSNHSGFISTKQPVRLKFNAFPYQKFGMVSATFDEVSKNILLPEQVNEVPFALQGPVFIAEAKLLSQTLKANGKNIPLKEGMLFEAEIELAEMRLWEWLLKPILSLRGTL